MVGSWGPIVFGVNGGQAILVPSTSRTSGKKIAAHEMISGITRSQYTGKELRTVSLEITLNASLGVRPREMLEQLNRLAESPAAYYLIISGKPMAENPMTITSISDDWETVYQNGELFHATGSVSFQEYM